MYSIGNEFAATAGCYLWLNDEITHNSACIDLLYANTNDQLLIPSIINNTQLLMPMCSQLNIWYITWSQSDYIYFHKYPLHHSKHPTYSYNINYMICSCLQCYFGVIVALLLFLVHVYCTLINVYLLLLLLNWLN